ncbi:flagellar hook-length control protein FliK [Cytobacillus oceanisediminis]|uniref:flagellar hook-length control protein FliK n=1 Tax=Cytobacillus oceanisediminis TaxID=665099 RepID=UPI00203B758C|nr:flagellar hook-length control protein FliK [Cytobacillus oceanisediminis]MCM3400791.1 flagellar hook-length control protein FliK [Cytobacillus oceanisediminis]MDK7665058.1 flagellar hook-length control protein FliK [Cytobacillus oceanisediminis]
MQIGGLGFIQAQYSSEDKRSLQDMSSTGFGSLFFSLTGTAKPQAESLPAAADEEKIEQLKELMEFLKVSEITELENGSGLLEKISLQTESDIIEVISEQLNLSQEELVQMLEGFMDQVLPGVKLEDVYSVENLDGVSKIQLLISAISNFDQKEGMILQGKDFSGALKALKLFDILSAKKDFFSSKINLKEFLNHVQVKIDGLINSTSVDKGSMIQKVFTPLANELNTAKQQNSSANENLGKGAYKIINRPETALQGFVQVQSFSKPEQMALLNPQGRTVSPDQLMQQFENILSKSSFLKTGGTQKLFIKLNPEHLGALRIELIQKDSAMIARILTSTGSAKEILDSHINGLKQAFSSQNIQIERIEISQQMTQQDRSFNRDPQQQEQRQQQNKDENDLQPESEFNSSFEEALLNTEA